MSGAELGLGIAGTVGTVHLLLKYGDLFVEKCKTFEATEAEIQEAVTRVEYHWTKTTWQLKIFERTQDHLDAEHRNLQYQILRILQHKLVMAVEQISKVEQTCNEPSRSRDKLKKRTRYTLLVKTCLDNTLQDLMKWQDMFDPLWYLMALVPGLQVDSSSAKADKIRPTPIQTMDRLRDSLRQDPQTHKSIFIDESNLDTAKRCSIPLSTLELLKRPGSNTLILESAAVDQDSNISAFTRDIRDLAGKLRNAEPVSFSILKCASVMKVRDSKTKKVQSFDFLFKIPKGMHEPQSLRKVLLDARNDHSLSVRFRLAKQLATSLSYVHTLGFVHKNIRPESILVFDDTISQTNSLFLVGFTTFRTVDGKTRRLGDLALENNIYRHPDRQGLYLDADYIMQHDIYSLGVCLLELGLWESFVAYDGNHNHLTQRAINSRSKDALTALARKELPKKMGDNYSRVVINCLTCLDKDNLDFGDESEFQDADGVLIAVRYIEKVLLQLESISV